MSEQYVEKLGIVTIDSCKFVNVESSSPIVTVFSLFLSQTIFYKCNHKSKIYSVFFTDAAEIHCLHCEKSGGISKTNDNYDNIKIFTSSIKKSISTPILIYYASIELSNINLSKIISEMALAIGHGPHGLSTRFITIADCTCSKAAQLEAETGYVNSNQRHIYIRNNASKALLYSYRARCVCQWFFFINNNISKIYHDLDIFQFTNSFSMDQLTGEFTGDVQVVTEVTEPIFPFVGIPRVLTECYAGTSLQLLFISLFIHKD